MSSSENDLLNRNQDKVLNLTNAANQSLINEAATEDIQVNIKPDTSVSLGKFKPHSFLVGTYLAHPTTIRAMKKSIFAVGDEIFEDLARPYTCQSCYSHLDLQFWHFCPYCEAQFEQNVDK
jgi:hypothetical protein